MKGIIKAVIKWFSKVSCKSKCCSGSSCECGPSKQDDGENDEN